MKFCPSKTLVPLHQGALGTVLERSRLLCLSRYDKERFSESDFREFYANSREAEPLNEEQMAAFAGAIS